MFFNIKTVSIIIQKESRGEGQICVNSYLCVSLHSKTEITIKKKESY